MSWWRRILTGFLVLGFGVAVGWAARTVILPPASTSDVPSEPITYRVGVDTVSRILEYTAVARWETTDGPRYRGGGVVTSVGIAAGDEVVAGDVIFSTDLLPVVIAKGGIPLTRTLQRTSRGDDVTQLQSFLVEAGLLEIEPDGIFGRSTEQAVKGWQRHLGIRETGMVDPARLVFTPDLPVRVIPGDDIIIDHTLSAEVVAFSILATEPTFRVPLTLDQARMVPIDTEVELAGDGIAWAATIEGVTAPEEGTVDYVLTGSAGGVCGVECELIPADAALQLRARFIIIPEQTGPAVPLAAIRTGPDGARFVRLSDGAERPVEVVVSVGGVAVVTGIEPGVDVVLIDAPPTP